MIDDQFIHVIKQIARQAVIEQRSVVYGHIASYDPLTNTARVIVPSMRDDQTGDPLFSGWLPMGVLAGGAQAGFQYVPYGGATPDKPTQGEWVQVTLNERGSGVAAITGIMYSAQQQPPHTALPPKNGLQPGDMIFRNAAGSSIWIHASGQIDVVTAKSTDVNVNSGGNVTVNTVTDGNITVTANGKGNMTVNSAGSGKTFVESATEIDLVAPAIKGGNGSTFQKLCMDNLRTLYNSHTHPSIGAPPSQQADTTYVTSKMTAE